MKRSSESALETVEQLAALARRLAARDLVVSSLHDDWAAFGSWSMQVQRGPAADAYGIALLNLLFETPGPDVILVAWDGREGTLRISTAPTKSLTSPGPWRPTKEVKLADDEEALRHAEEVIVKWAGQGH